MGLPVARITDLRRDPSLRGVRVGTFEYAKGLEFKVVIMVGPGASDWLVQPYWMQSQSDLEAWARMDRRKLFVAMTRARDRLVVVATEPLCRPVPEGAQAFAEYDWR